MDKNKARLECVMKLQDVLAELSVLWPPHYDADMPYQKIYQMDYWAREMLIDAMRMIEVAKGYLPIMLGDGKGVYGCHVDDKPSEDIE